MRIEKNRQRIAAAAAAATAESPEPRPGGRLQPPPDPEAFQTWLADTRAKVSFFLIQKVLILCHLCNKFQLNPSIG
jgi:hypothetical protein